MFILIHDLSYPVKIRIRRCKWSSFPCKMLCTAYNLNKKWEKSFKADGDKSGLQEVDLDGTISNMTIQDMTEEYLENATPGKGTLAYAVGYQRGVHRKEVEIGEWLHSTLGGDIILLQEAIECNRKTPDYAWGGKYWELKSISSAKAADSAFRTAAKQIQENPGGIILELSDGIEVTELENVLLSRFRRVGIDEIDILIVFQKVLKKVLRYKK